MRSVTFSSALKNLSFSVICIFVITSDAKCGKIQCSASASKPIENNAVRIETTVSGDKKKFVCLGTHVYNLQPGDEEPQGDTLDPGLVLTGTKCDSDSVRLVKRCSTEVTKIRSVTLCSYFSNVPSHMFQQICFNGECRNASFLRTAECNVKCHGHGVSFCVSAAMWAGLMDLFRIVETVGCWPPFLAVVQKNYSFYLSD